MFTGHSAESTAPLQLSINPTCSKTDRQADRLCLPSGKFILDFSACIKRTTAIHASFYPSFSAIILMTGALGD